MLPRQESKPIINIAYLNLFLSDPHWWLSADEAKHRSTRKDLMRQNAAHMHGINSAWHPVSPQGTVQHKAPGYAAGTVCFTLPHNSLT